MATTRGRSLRRDREHQPSECLLRFAAPHLLRNPNLAGNRSRDEKIQQFFDTAAFRAPGDGVIGAAGRTNGAGPGFFGLDLSIHKIFQLSDRFGRTFRTDIVNFPNVPAFAAPDQARGDGNFGKIGNVLGLSTGREIQVSLGWLGKSSVEHSLTVFSGDY